MTRQELLQAFCSDNELRPRLSKPFRQGGYTCATDAHFAIMLPTVESDVACYDIKQTPEVLHFLGQVGKAYAEIKSADLKTALHDIELGLAQVDTRCPECKGEGEVTFHYWDRNSECHTTEDVCPECEGSGYMDIADWYGKKKYTYPLDDTHGLRVTALRVIDKVIDYFGLDSVELLQSTTADTFPYHIVGDGFHVCIMPALTNQDEDEDE